MKDIQTNERLILEGLSNLAMKPNETTNEVLCRITRTMRLMKESFYDYGGVIPYPQNDLNGGISNNTFRTFIKQYNAMMVNFFKMYLFKAALTPELRAVVAQQDPETTTIKKMYMVATSAQREGKGKTMAPISKIREDEFQPELEEDENDVVAFNRRFSNQGGARPKTGNQTSQGIRNYQNVGRGGQADRGPAQQGGSGPGKNTDRNGKYCYYCKQQGHRQEECWKRIRENKPCRDAQGRLYWPRIYLKD
jgi:hypothetical protein